MLRGDNIICGTSTTGTGTLTLAATPTPPGGIDFDVFARATGIGFGNSAAILVSYAIIEYTDSTFATAKSHEKGIGTLTLGGSSGIANATLARTTKQTSATSLNSQPATQNIAPGTGINIGTAANTLVFIGPSAADVMGYSPYIQTTAGDSNLGAMPMNSIGVSGTVNSTAHSSTVEFYIPFMWGVPMLVKRATVNVTTAPTGNTNADAHLYAIGTDGRPGKLLYDFGLFGSANSSLNSTGNIQTGAAGAGFMLLPGEYYFGFLAVYAAGSLTTLAAQYGSYLRSGRFGATSMVPNAYFTANPGTIGAAPDPAMLTSWANGGVSVPLFGLSPT